MSDPHAEYFRLFSTCLVAPPGEELLAGLKARAAGPSLGEAHPDLAAGWAELGAFLRDTAPDTARQVVAGVHHRLVGDPVNSALQPYASWYRDGARLGRALVEFRGFLRRWNLVAETSRFRDLEDHAAFQLDCAARLGELAADQGGEWNEAREQCVRDHLLPWLPRFFQDLEREARVQPGGGFYAGLARLAAGILDLEARALTSPTGSAAGR